MMGNLVPVKESEPPWTPLLNGWSGVAPEDAGREGGVELGEGGGDLGLLDGWVIDRLKRAGTQGAGHAALAPVFKGVGSKPPIGMPWAPKAMTRTISELSRPIRIACWSVIGQISCASGSLVVLGLASFGSCSGMVALRRSALLDVLVLQRDSPEVVMRDRLGLIEVGKSLAPG